MEIDGTVMVESLPSMVNVKKVDGKIFSLNPNVVSCIDYDLPDSLKESLKEKYSDFNECWIQVTWKGGPAFFISILEPINRSFLRTMLYEAWVDALTEQQVYALAENLDIDIEKEIALKSSKESDISCLVKRIKCSYS